MEPRWLDQRQAQVDVPLISEPVPSPLKAPSLAKTSPKYLVWRKTPSLIALPVSSASLSHDSHSNPALLLVPLMCHFFIVSSPFYLLYIPRASPPPAPGRPSYVWLAESCDSGSHWLTAVSKKKNLAPISLGKVRYLCPHPLLPQHLIHL